MPSRFLPFRKLISLDDYVAEFMAYWRRSGPRSSGLVTDAADLRVAAQSNNELSNNDNSNQKKFPKCLCGMKH